MRLTTGSQAPDFIAQDWQGNPICLSEIPGQRWLAFFRYAGCPLCNLRVHHIIERHDALKAKGLSVIAVFQSPGPAIAKYVGPQAPPFPLVSDPKEELYARYGLETSLAGYLSPANLGRAAAALKRGFMPGIPDGSHTRIPGDFLIDASGTIRKTFYGRVIADHIPFEDVEAFLNAEHTPG